MRINEIIVSDDQTHFLFNEQQVFKSFIQVLKFHREGIAAVEDESGWFHIDLQGKAVYNDRYDRVFGYYFERAAVVKNNKWFHINTKGERIYKSEFAWCGNYQDGICGVKDTNNAYYHIDLLGNPIYEARYNYVGDFKDKCACVRMENKRYKHIDTSGNDLNDNLFEDLGVFHKSYATAKDSIGWFHIDRLGNELYRNRYLLVEPFYNGCALVEKFDGDKLVIDEQGIMIHNLR
jgi:hypothetical protein